MPPLSGVRVPLTSAVCKSTALLVEPLPTKFDAVRVSDTIASVTELAGRASVPETVRFVKLPVEGVVAPTGVLFIVPPDIVRASVT